MNSELPDFPEIAGVEFRHCLNAIGYAASSDGRVWCCRKTGGHGGYRTDWRPLKPQKHNQGYLMVSLGKANLRLLHCIVLEAFVGPAPDGMEGCHYPDKDKRNCRIENISWGTRSKNILHRIVQGGSSRGEMNWNAKLNKESVIQVVEMLEAGSLSHEEIASKFNVTRRTVGRIGSGELWSHVTGRTRCSN